MYVYWCILWNSPCTHNESVLTLDEYRYRGMQWIWNKVSDQAQINTKSDHVATGELEMLLWMHANNKNISNIKLIGMTRGNTKAHNREMCEMVLLDRFLEEGNHKKHVTIRE